MVKINQAGSFRYLIVSACIMLSVFFSANAYGQLNINGATSIVIGNSYSYYPTFNGSGTYPYSGSYTYAITGGVVSGTSNTTKSGTNSGGILYTMGVNVTWTSSSGTLSLYCGLGSKTITVAAIASLDPGTISTTTPNINYGTTPATITGTAASGGAASPSYTYQWQSCTDAVSWVNISGATGQNYSPGVLYATTYYRRQVTETTTSTVGYTSTLTLTVYPQLTCSVTPAIQTVISGSNASTLTANASGGNGTYSYQWYVSTDNVNWSTTGTNASTFSPGLMTATKFYRVIVTSNSVNVTSNTATVSVCAAATTTGPITGPSTCVIGSTIQLANSTPGGTWSSSNAAIAKVASNGVVTGVASGTVTITYTVTNSCGTASSTANVTVIAYDAWIQSLGNGIPDPVYIDTITLSQGNSKTREFQQDTLYSLAHSIKNVIAFRVIEETGSYIPGDFTATAVVKVEYGHSSADINVVDSIKLVVNYTKNQGTKYNALNYYTINNAEFIRLTLVRLDAPTTVNSISYDTKQVLLLTNTLVGTRYYKLADNKKATLTHTTPASGTVPDVLRVDWIFPDHTQNNAVQLEWAWMENEMSGEYTTNNIFDTGLLFKNSSTRIDLPTASKAGTYNIPLLYDGTGKLFFRIRGISLMPSGSRSDGPWSAIDTFAFAGHNDSLNWQSTTSYAEEGKRKTVVQYYDGSLRPRQTVTKDNSTGTTVVAETFYDGQGRPAIQVLPAPGIKNIIAYTKNLNKFNTQADNTDPLDYFDFTTSTSGFYATKPLDTTRGTARYYSSLYLQDDNTPYNKNIPVANGYAYTATRYTPDATGRIMSQGGVGDSLNTGSGHATMYYYGTPAQEELDALFGTEAGNYTHYFKNMVQDANGQMSVSYVDMHGRTVATALAGNAPLNLQALNTSDTTQYKNQAGKTLTRNLLDKGSNVLKGNSIESVNTVLVPFRTNYSFNYVLGKQILQMPKCSTGTVAYPCKFDLQISVTDESGLTTPVVYNYTGIDTVNFQQTLQLAPGSYIVRKTLTINQDSLNKFIAQYNTVGVGLCKSAQALSDSLYNQDSTGCGINTAPLTSANCMTSITPYSAYQSNYATSIGKTVATLTAEQLNDVKAQYVNDSTFCAALNSNISHRLEAIRQQMLADMIPYSGQYARDTGTSSMYYKYNIFALTGKTGWPQPLYRYPRLILSPTTPDYYYDSYGNIDTSVTNTKLASMTMQDFEQSFKSSWTKSLIAYHPEYNKLKFAEDSLRSSFNFLDSLQFINTAFAPVNSDPYFAITSRVADRDSMRKYSDTAWAAMNNYSMWQMAYGDACGCKTQTDQTTRTNCFTNMPKRLATIGTVINTGSGNVTLTTAMQTQAWNVYRAFYGQVRGDMINRYINVRPGTTDTADNRTLINQGFRLYFPYNNVQQAQNTGWTSWYPNQNGTLPTVNLTDSVKIYSRHCDSYINAWRLALLNCPDLYTKMNNDTTKVEQVVASITGKMFTVCKNGTDGANPYGASTVSPANAGATYTSFEQAAKAVFDSINLNYNLYCHPYNIEWPKPYGKNPTISSQYISAIDTCTCNRYYQLVSEYFAAGGTSNSLASINSYVGPLYGDTISQVLYDGLQKCGQPFVYNCITKDTTYYDPKSQSYYPGTVTHCDTLYTIPLASPQTLPVFLKCGFNKANYNCFNCSDFKTLDSTFNLVFGRHPVFTGSITNDTTIAWNDLFAKYVNFKTGLQHTWQYYADKFSTNSCGIGGLTGAGAGLSICLDRKTLNDTTGFTTTITACDRTRMRATEKANLLYDYNSQQAVAALKAAYISQCLLVAESFNVTDTVKEYHYTLYYYDQAGNLVKTVPPKGVKPDYSAGFLNSVKTERGKMLAGQSWTQTVPQHSLVTRYCYNSLNQVTLQKSPDGGVSKFYYDRLGRLTVSQNAKQVAGNQYSYTYYDALGRITEVGQLTSGIAMTDATAKSVSGLQTWFNNVSSSRNQITQTIYDTAYGAISGVTLSQQNLRNRVSFTQVVNNATDTYAASATYYSYDIHGNVDTLLQDFGNSSGIANAMNQTSNRFKKIVYNYDLISGKVKQVSYQSDQWDAFYHRYSYNAENRLITVETSRDKIYWEREAQYSYYKYGPLAKTIVGQLQVQKQDYVYTLQGWLKSVNPDNTVSGVIAKNVYSLVLDYYNIDYRGIGTASPSAGIPSQLGADNKPLFNGNISSMGVNIPKLGNSILYNFQYDQLNRVVSMDAWTSTNDVWAGLNKVSDYKERLSYDANGNILTYLRNGTGSSLNLNNYTYTYTTGTNRLASITNSVNSNTDTYSYDAIGNITKDDKQNVSTANWNVNGKLQSVTKTIGTQISYTYGIGGNRILKTINDTTEAYVRDASGNIMSVYKKAGSAGSLKQSEINIYGSSMLGTVSELSVATQTTVLASGFGNSTMSMFTRGEKEFLLTDHRGNNMVSISDRRQQYSAGGITVDYYLADVKTASYYSTFGAISNFYNADSIKYAFNGQRRSKEISVTSQTALFWEFNGDVGRRWNVDPKPTVGFSSYATFNNNPIFNEDPLGDTLQPLTTQILRQMARSAGFTGVGIVFNRKVGKAFETIGLYAGGYGAENTMPFRSTERSSATAGASNIVIPDGVRSAKKVESQLGLKIPPISFKTTIYPNSSFAEVKAVNGVIKLSSSNYQIQGELDALKNTSGGKAGVGTMTFITTANTIIGPDVIEYANVNNLKLYQVIAFRETDDNTIHFTPPLPLVTKGVDVTPLFRIVDIKFGFSLNQSWTRPENPTNPDKEEVDE